MGTIRVGMRYNSRANVGLACLSSAWCGLIAARWTRGPGDMKRSCCGEPVDGDRRLPPSTGLTSATRGTSIVRNQDHCHLRQPHRSARLRFRLRVLIALWYAAGTRSLAMSTDTPVRSIPAASCSALVAIRIRARGTTALLPGREETCGQTRSRQDSRHHSSLRTRTPVGPASR